MRYAQFIILLALLTACGGKKKKLMHIEIPLHDNWVFSSVSDSSFHPAKIPGQVHLDLLKNQLIEEPYEADHELKLRWIEEENWIYKCTFNVGRKTYGNENIELHFEGLDTYATVYLNENKILSADNMFRSWEVDVKNQIKRGENELRIVFQSPIERNRTKVESNPYLLPSGNETSEIETKVSSFTRKAAFHFGWDWCPRFVTAGIWRPVKLVTWNKVRIKNICTTTLSVNREVAKMRTLIDLEVSETGTYEILLKQKTSIVDLVEGSNQIVHNFDIHKPQMWWPNGHGDAYLYEQRVRVRLDKKVLDDVTDTYGIRTVELINEPDSIGTSFYFKVNGKPIFMKGANYIPQDLFQGRVTEGKYDTLIAAVKEANMNMLRVWGGGIYEEDYFYDLCDKNGILVWQDFMFANSLYPDNESFKENIAEEVKANIIRLSGHPCIALWCGNNEIEVAWKNWGWQEQFDYSSKDSTKIWNNYQDIFHDLIPSVVEEFSPHIDYTTTSPLSNWGNPENFNHSSMHYWGVWHGREPFENFEKNIGRFMVEYGFQSYPELETLKTVLPDSCLSLESPMIRIRQKSYIGNGLIKKHIEQYFDTPVNFEEFVQLSQETQAKGLRMALETHLASQPHCMGTLFWQLNDCWPGPSWSVIDYYGNKKTAYTEVKEAFRE
ncbi:MAG: glycoside hydrolase family 2 protein [Flavobacteriales bacterium]|nr:glycoside hydrolase family 2 protein [Flavobacteriales bacterium]